MRSSYKDPLRSRCWRETRPKVPRGHHQPPFEATEGGRRNCKGCGDVFARKAAGCWEFLPPGRKASEPTSYQEGVPAERLAKGREQKEAPATKSDKRKGKNKRKKRRQIHVFILQMTKEQQTSLSSELVRAQTSKSKVLCTRHCSFFATLRRGPIFCSQTHTRLRKDTYFPPLSMLLLGSYICSCFAHLPRRRPPPGCE